MTELSVMRTLSFPFCLPFFLFFFYIFFSFSLLIFTFFFVLSFLFLFYVHLDIALLSTSIWTTVYISMARYSSWSSEGLAVEPGTRYKYPILLSLSTVPDMLPSSDSDTDRLF